MPTLTPLKCYALARQPITYRDLSVNHDGRSKLAVVFSSSFIQQALGGTRTLRIQENEGGLYGSVLCTAIRNNKNKSLEIRLPALNETSERRTYNIQFCQGTSAMDDEFRFRFTGDTTVSFIAR